MSVCHVLQNICSDFLCSLYVDLQNILLNVYVHAFLQTGGVNTAIQPCILVLFCTNFVQYIQKLAIFSFSFPPLLPYVVFMHNICVTLMTMHCPIILSPWQFSQKSWAISLMTRIQVPEAVQIFLTAIMSQKKIILEKSVAV